MPKKSKPVCRHGAACTRPNCHFGHPERHSTPPAPAFHFAPPAFDDHSEGMQLQRAMMNKFEQDHAIRLEELRREKEAADAYATALFMSKFGPLA